MISNGEDEIKEENLEDLKNERKTSFFINK